MSDVRCTHWLGGRFHHEPSQAKGHQDLSCPVRGEFLPRLATQIVDRLARISGLTTVVFPIDDTEVGSPTALDQLPHHPDCNPRAGFPRCRESLGAHMSELRVRPGVHWHRCPLGKYCGVVPNEDALLS